MWPVQEFVLIYVAKVTEANKMIGQKMGAVHFVFEVYLGRYRNTGRNPGELHGIRGRCPPQEQVGR